MEYIEKFEIGGCTIYHGDSLKILPFIKDTDLLVSDPPYKLESGGNTTTKNQMTGKFNPKNYSNDGSIVECDLEWRDFMYLFHNCLNKNAHAYVMCNNRHVSEMISEAVGSEFRFHNLLVWDKGNATPNRWYMKNCEFTGFFFKGKAKFIRDMGAKQLIYIPQESYGTHPTTKPVMLMRHYIEQSSETGDTVIDPFMGSCPVGVAAMQSGRKFIGIEIDKKWFELSKKRLIEEFKRNPDRIQKDLFTVLK